MDAFYDMQAAAAADGISLWILSSFRSYEDQDVIYNRYVAQDGRDAADTYSSRPGHSDHQTGYTFDLNSLEQDFQYDPAGKWLDKNFATSTALSSVILKAKKVPQAICMSRGTSDTSA